MKAQDALTTFNEYADVRQVSLAVLSAPQAIDLMIKFYTTLRAEDCDVDVDGDMLLFQWGTYDWDDGTYFSYDITRQFIFPTLAAEEGEVPDDSIWQLSLTLKYVPTPRLEAIHASNRWCERPHDVSDFAQFIAQHETTQLLQLKRPEAVTLEFYNAE